MCGSSLVSTNSLDRKSRPLYGMRFVILHPGILRPTVDFPPMGDPPFLLSICTIWYVFRTTSPSLSSTFHPFSSTLRLTTSLHNKTKHNTTTTMTVIIVLLFNVAHPPQFPSRHISMHSKQTNKMEGHPCILLHFSSLLLNNSSILFHIFRYIPSLIVSFLDVPVF